MLSTFNDHYLKIIKKIFALTSAKKNLKELFNDESFVNWIRGEADPEMKNKWDRWFLKDQEHQEIVKRARKLLNLPFKNIDVNHHIPEELERLKKGILDYENDH